jgi:hypothetical protein
MKLEEYIVKRKNEDGINEYDFDKRNENTRVCVNYVFEYFNNYLDTQPADEKTVLHEQKIDKYRSILREYEAEVHDWLVSMYSSYGKYMHRQLMNLVTDDYFLLYDSEAEFRALSYDIYPKAVKRFKFLDGQSEMVFRFVKEAHRVRSIFPAYVQDFYISDSINEWILDTYRKNGVNLYVFCNEWALSFYDHPETWPKGHKKKSIYYEKRSEYTCIKPPETLFWDYDYKQKSNLFGLDDLYKRMPKKSFVRGKKQEFEATIMYFWLHGITSDGDYWEE